MRVERTRSRDGWSPSGQGRDPLPHGSKVDCLRIAERARVRRARSPFARARSAAREVGGQRREHLDGSPRQRVRRTPGAWRAGTGAPGRARPAVAVLGVAAHRDGRSPAGARGSGGCARCPGAAAAASSAGSARSSVKWVRASRGWSPPTAMRVRTRGSRPIGASIVPRARRRAALAPARGTRARSAARRAPRCSSRWASSERATTSRPEVSRSSRWTMPGALRARRRRASASEQLGERALAMPARGVHDQAGGLVDHQQVLVL